MMSPKQMEWLESLYKKHVGSLETAGGSRSEIVRKARKEIIDDAARFDQDIDDEIPF